MGISVSILLAAAGAVLLWAVNATSSAVNIHTVGAILLIVGIVGFVVSLFFWSSWGGFGGARDGRTVVVDRERDVL
jgi:beta-lactamase regulating signal transducer with metallopeptidase domain